MAAPPAWQRDVAIHEAQPRRRLLARIDRRILRSAIYSVLTLALLALFKAVEWLFEHRIAGGENLRLPAALGMAVSLALIFQIFHKRVEEALSHWLNRVAHTREHEMVELAREIPLIQDAKTLQQRVVDRLDRTFGVSGSALYVIGRETAFDIACGSSTELPRSVRADDPALIHANLHRTAVVPADRGSSIPGRMIWPVSAQGRISGFVLLGNGTGHETLDPFQIDAVGRVADAIGTSLALLERAGPPLPDKPSIAVLPFQSLGEDPEQSFFADGAVEDITTALSQYRWLFVIARNSGFAYKDRAVDAKQIGRELGVRYLVEGSVRKSGQQVRITGQLIDAVNGVHLWADRIEGPLGDLFALQDRVTTAIVGAIMPKLEEAEIHRVCSRPTESLEAYEQYVRGLSAAYRLDSDGSNMALERFRRAAALDPGYALAHARIADCIAFRKSGGWMTDVASETREASEAARSAVALGRDDATALAMAGFALGYVVRELDLGAEYVARSLSMTENVAEAWAASTWMQICFGRHDVAVEHGGRAMRLSPRDPRIFRWKMYIALAHLHSERYAEAAQWAASSLADQPNFMAALRISAAAHALGGEKALAQTAITRLLERDPTLRVSNLDRVSPPYRRASDRERLEEGLRMAGLPA